MGKKRDTYYGTQDETKMSTFFKHDLYINLLHENDIIIDFYNKQNNS